MSELGLRTSRGVVIYCYDKTLYPNGDLHQAGSCFSLTWDLPNATTGARLEFVIAIGEICIALLIISLSLKLYLLKTRSYKQTHTRANTHESTP
jgi:hypothetical protein